MATGRARRSTKNEAHSRKESLTQRKAPSVGDTLKLSSGAEVTVTKVTAKCISYKSVVGADSIGINDEYTLIASNQVEKEVACNNASTSDQPAEIDPAIAARIKIGTRGRKHFDHKGWCFGTITAVNSNACEVKYDDNTIESLNSNQILSFLEELETLNDIPPPVRAALQADASRRASSTLVVTATNSDTANECETTSGTSSPVRPAFEEGLNDQSSPTPIVTVIDGPTSLDSERIVEKVHTGLDSTNIFGDHRDYPHNQFSELNPTNGQLNGRDSFNDIANVKARQSGPIGIESVGSQLHIPVQSNSMSNLVEVPKGNVKFRKRSLQTSMNRSGGSIKISIYQGMAYCNSRLRLDKDTPAVIRGEAYRLRFSTDKSVAIVVSVLFRFRNVGGSMDYFFKRPMMAIGQALKRRGEGESSSCHDRMIIIQTSTLEKKPLDCSELQEMLNIDHEQLMKDTIYGHNFALEWIRDPAFESDLCVDMSAKCPYPGATMVAQDDDISKSQKGPQDEEEGNDTTGSGKGRRRRYTRKNKADNETDDAQQIQIYAKNSSEQNTRRSDGNEIFDPKRIRLMGASEEADLTKNNQAFIEAALASERVKMENKHLHTSLIELKNQQAVSDRINSDHHNETTALWKLLHEDSIKNRERESVQNQETLKMFEHLHRQGAANMLKSQLVAQGSSSETNAFMGTALTGSFFSSTPPDIRVSRQVRNDTYEVECENAAVPSRLMLKAAPDDDSSIKLDTSGGSENERIRNKKTNMIHKLKTALTTAEGDMKERLENAISKLEEEVKELNDIIASSLLEECLVD